jgi:NDP-sugar pyrophosphorylase family protein
MKAILICPGYRPAVERLAEFAPLATLPFLGESLLVYWLVHLASLGAQEITVLASDRPGAIRQIAGNGSRWGLRVRIIGEMQELTVAEARAAYVTGEGWLPAPHDIVRADHLPGMPEHRLFESYAEWFAAAQAWLERAVTPDRVGVKEIAPGIRVGWHSLIPDDAVLLPPCWIGEKVTLGAGVTIGPNAIIEDRAVVGPDAEVKRSVVGPDTLVGDHTEVADSLAFGNTLINWRDGSSLRVPDEFLLCSLRQSAGALATAARELLAVDEETDDTPTDFLLQVDPGAEKLCIRNFRDRDGFLTDDIVDEIRAALRNGIRVVEIDLSNIHSFDCGAVDRLLAIHNAISHADALIWRLLNPPAAVRQLLELLRLHNLFEITPPRLERAVL